MPSFFFLKNKKTKTKQDSNSSLSLSLSPSYSWFQPPIFLLKHAEVLTISSVSYFSTTDLFFFFLLETSFEEPFFVWTTILIFSSPHNDNYEHHRLEKDDNNTEQKKIYMTLFWQYEVVLSHSITSVWSQCQLNTSSEGKEGGRYAKDVTWKALVGELGRSRNPPEVTYTQGLSSVLRIMIIDV